MTDWNDLGHWINGHNLGSKTWRSEKRSLLEIFLEARNLGIDPEIAAPCYPYRLSHLRTIIRPAKEAIAAHDRGRLIDLFNSAGTMTVVQLRLYIGTPTRQVIRFNEYQLLGLPVSYVELFLTRPQFDRISNVTQLQYHFLPRVEESEHQIEA